MLYHYLHCNICAETVDFLTVGAWRKGWVLQELFHCVAPSRKLELIFCFSLELPIWCAVVNNSDRESQRNGLLASWEGGRRIIKRKVVQPELFLPRA